MFWHQKRDSSIWGSRDIKRFRTKKNLFGGGGVRNQEVMKRGEMQKNLFDFRTDCHIFRNLESNFRNQIPKVTERAISFFARKK